MAVTHVTEAEAARDLPALLDRATAGESIQIDRPTSSFGIKLQVETPKVWTISEAIRRSEQRGSTAILDDRFSEDMEAIRQRHEHERLRDRCKE